MLGWGCANIFTIALTKKHGDIHELKKEFRTQLTNSYLIKINIVSISEHRNDKLHIYIE